MLHTERQNNMNKNIFFIFFLFYLFSITFPIHTMNDYHTKVSKYQHITKYPPYIFLFLSKRKIITQK
ncbi:hypothetical protein DXB41_13075 [Segatella copri]|nr:hypothetical protein DXB41_13075 [Segatella copri]